MSASKTGKGKLGKMRKFVPSSLKSLFSKRTDMKSNGILTFLVFLALHSIGQNANQFVLPKGESAPMSYFTGNVWVYPVAQDSLAHWYIGKVTFEASAHSNWHVHSGKQVLVVLEGTGYVKEQGKGIQTLKKGDVVTIQAGVKHWHGATPERGFIQLVVNSEIKNAVVNWLERVTDEEYRTKK